MSSSFALQGTGVALVTPFKENKEIDFEALERVLQHTYAAGTGVDYWVVQGTTGESVTLRPHEKKQVIDFVRAHNPAKLPIVYGVGGNDTQEILATIQGTDFEGITAILSVSPYYNKPSQRGLIAHFTAIADAAPVPVVLYNVPGRTAVNLKAETTLAIAEHSNVIAVKESSGDLQQCMEIMRHKPSHFHLLAGDDWIAAPMIAIGAEGVVSVLANAFPTVFGDMVRTALAGDFAASVQHWYKLTDLNPLMYEEGNPVGVKQSLALLGVCSSEVRLPLVKASNSLEQRIKQAMLAQHLLG